MTKVIDLTDIIRICEQKKQTGDYQTLAKALMTTTDAARMRYRRGDENAVKVLYDIIKHRENLIQKYQSRSS